MSFSQDFRSECIQGSAIDPALYEAAIEVLEDSGNWVAQEALGLNLPRFWQFKQPHNYGDLACLNNEDGNLWQAKPEFPIVDPKTGKPTKYLAPKGNGARAFTPAITVGVWRKICKRNRIQEESIWLEALEQGRISLKEIENLSGYRSNESHKLSRFSGSREGNSPWMERGLSAAQGQSSKGFSGNSQRSELSRSNQAAELKKALRCLLDEMPIDATVPGFWAWVANQKNLELCLTEGGKKALSLLSQGYVAIALFGINAGVSKFEHIAGEKLRKANPELIPDLQPYACEGRRFVLAFDRDVKLSTQRKVAAALGDLSWHLEQAGCIPSIAEWDGLEGRCKGVDDLIAHAGVKAWEDAHRQAIPARQWRIQREIKKQVRRRADLYIGDREFSAALPSLPASGIVAFHGGKGTGKSKAIGEILDGRQWLSLTHRIALGRDQGGGWGGILINDGDRYGDRLLDAQGQPVAGGTACYPSLLKVNRIQADVLILDEITAGLDFLLSSQICNKQGIRPLLLAEFQRRIVEADLVLIADADLTEDALRYIEAIRGERAYLVRSDRKALTYPCHTIEGSQNAAIAALIERCEALEDGKAIYINSDSKKLADSLATLLEGMGIQSLLITADTSGGEVEGDFLASKGAALPGLIAQGVKAIISSPSVSQGFSIEAHTDLIDSVWGLYRGGSIAVADMAQALDRVRDNACPRFVWVANHGSAYSRLSQALTVPAFLRDFQRIGTAAARLVRHSLIPEAIAATDALDWQSENLKMLASLEVRRNRGMVDLRDSLIAHLRSEGKQIIGMVPSISIGEARAANDALKAAAKAIALAEAEAIAAARVLAEAEAEALGRKSEALSLEESRAMQKYYLAQFYRADVDSELVLFDRSGATRQEIRNLERVLDSAKATDRTASSINQNPDTPQDWSKAAVKAWLFEQSGFSALVRSIVAGEITVLSAKVNAPIADFVRGHAEEFRLAFGFSKLESISDQQIVGQMLRSVGIQSKRVGNRKNHRYEVRKAELEALLAIIERRKKEITPPPTLDLNQGGVIPLEALEKGAFDSHDREDGGYFEYDPASGEAWESPHPLPIGA